MVDATNDRLRFERVAVLFAGMLAPNNRTVAAMRPKHRRLLVNDRVLIKRTRGMNDEPQQSVGRVRTADQREEEEDDPSARLETLPGKMRSARGLFSGTPALLL